MAYSRAQILEWQIAVKDLDTLSKQKREREVLVSELSAVRPGNSVFVQRTSGSVFFYQEPAQALSEQKGRVQELEQKHADAKQRVKDLQQQIQGTERRT